ncbi:MAG TPA: formate/nitrite transporter family protein, partial [Longimicrobiales bacterium]|nr:formate/nitrite transporter family protein [Longimicrobiales bacterium]
MTPDADPRGTRGGPPLSPASRGDGTADADAPMSEEAGAGGASGEEGRDQPKSYGTILEEEIFQGLHELERPPVGLFLSGLSAGLDIGFSVFFMAVLLSLMGGDLADPLTRILLANAYPIGFVFVIVGRSELFTEHTALAVFPVLGGRAGLGRLARLWGIVYVSNLIGAAAFAAMAVWVGPPLGVVSPAAFGGIAGDLVRTDWHVTLASALLAGWMMGLLSWTLSAAQETISRILLVWLVTSGIGLAGLHHCIVGSVEVLAGMFAGYQDTAQYATFLLWTTLGNALGGVIFVSIIKYSHAVKGPGIPTRRS